MAGSRLLAVVVLGALSCFAPLLSSQQAASGQSPATKQTKREKESATAQAVSRLRFEKNNSEEYVLRAKRMKGNDSEGHVRVERANELYGTAKSAYNAYVDTFLDSIVDGKDVDLSPSANKAAVAASTFEKYVDENSQSKGVSAVLTVAKEILQAATGIRDDWIKRKRDERKRRADAIRPTIIWTSWDDIKH